MTAAAPSAESSFAGIPLAPGVVLWERLRLEKPLVVRPDCWLASDLRTGAVHALELLRPHEPASVSTRDAAKIRAALEAAAAVSHPHLLASYRVEGDWPELGVITAAPAMLAENFLPAAEALHGDATRALAWLVALAAAVRAIHAGGHPAHGAITPRRVLTDATGAPLLTGYAHAAWFDRDLDAAFLGPARRNGAAPTAADDIFALGALAYQVFNNGAPPPAAGEAPAIDSWRAAHGLPPLGWPEGWDESIRRALAADAAARPPSVDDLLDVLGEKLGELAAPPRADRAADAPVRLRRPPAWRRRPPRAAATNDAGAGAGAAEAPIAILEKIQRARAELARRREALARDEAAAAARQSELKAFSDRLERDSAELRTAQEKLHAGEHALAAARTRLEHEQRELEQRLAALTAGQDALRQDKENVRAHESQVGARERDVREAERALNEISGGAGAKHWRTFTKQLAAEKTDAERQLQKLAASRSESLARPAASVTSPSPTDSVPPSAPIEAAAASAVPAPALEAAPPPLRPETSVPPVLPPPPLPPAPDVRKASLVVGNRRLHVFGGPVVRFGRHSDSDVLLVAVSSGSAQPSPGINREISRKHFELRAEGDHVRVIDGWSDDGKPSQHGLCVDGRRVGPAGAALRSNTLLSLTTRAPGGSVPHWRVTLFTRAELAPDGATRAILAAAFLQRLDHAPDDVLLVLERAALKELGLSESVYQDAAIVRRAGEFAWQVGEQVTPFAPGASPFPSITVFSLGAPNGTPPPSGP